MTAYDGRPLHMVMGEVVPKGVTIKASKIGKSQFLKLEGDIELVAGFVAQLLHSIDWHLEQRTPGDRLEIQRKIDALAWKDRDDD